MAWTFTFPLDDQAWFRFSSKRFPCRYSRASDRQVAISLSRSKYQKDKNEADEKIKRYEIDWQMNPLVPDYSFMNTGNNRVEIFLRFCAK